MINNVNVEGFVAKINNFVYNGDKTGVHFDLGHQVYHPKTEKEEAHYTSEFFHCVALGGMVKRILAKCHDGSLLIEKGTRQRRMTQDPSAIFGIKNRLPMPRLPSRQREMIQPKKWQQSTTNWKMASGAR